MDWGTVTGTTTLVLYMPGGLCGSFGTLAWGRAASGPTLRDRFASLGYSAASAVVERRGACQRGKTSSARFADCWPSGVAGCCGNRRFVLVEGSPRNRRCNARRDLVRKENRYEHGVAVGKTASKWKLSLDTWAVLVAFLLALLVRVGSSNISPGEDFQKNGDNETWLMQSRFRRFSRSNRRCDFCGIIPGICCSPRSATRANCGAKRRAYAKAHHWTFPNIEYVLWAIVLGLVISNTIGVPEIFRSGMATYEFWLKAGIVLLGARFLLGDILKLGGVSLVLVAIEIVGSLAFMTFLGRLFKLKPKLTTLLAVGSAVCGVSAIIATKGAIEADDEDSSFSIAAILALGALLCSRFRSSDIFCI